MEQKYIKFGEAVARLGVTSERLNELREAGKLRGFRDGASWKFSADEIEKMAAEGVPDVASASDIGLGSLDLGLEDDLDLAVVPEPSAAPASRPTVGDVGEQLTLADEDGLDLDLELPEDFAGGPGSDSILLSEEELGGAADQSPSTIIGKHDQPDADLELVDESSSLSDVKLAAGGSDVLSSGIAQSARSRAAAEAGGSNAFEDLEELEIDLEEEASRIHLGESAAVRDLAGGKSADAALEPSDLDLQLNDEPSDVPVAPPRSNRAQEKRTVRPSAGGSDLALGDEDDLVLSDAAGSDLTLDGADSGINLVDPADSGLALDAMPLDVSGSAILSGLNLDSLGSDADMELVSDAGRPGERAGKGGKAAKLQADDEFNLTPIAEGGLDDQDSSSQVIALDGDEPAGPGGGGNGLLDDFEGGVGDVEWNPDGEGVAAEGLDVSPYGGAIAVRSESEYSLMNLLGLGSAAMLLALGSMLLIDIVRNIWSWNQPFALNSPLLDGLCGLFGLK